MAENVAMQLMALKAVKIAQLAENIAIIYDSTSKSNNYLDIKTSVQLPC